MKINKNKKYKKNLKKGVKESPGGWRGGADCGNTGKGGGVVSRMGGSCRHVIGREAATGAAREALGRKGGDTEEGSGSGVCRERI